MEAPIEHRRELLARGFTDGELRRRLRTRELVAVRRGSYLAADAVPQATDARHRLRVRAARRAVAPDAVTSHVSAAVMHGLPVWNIPLDRVHVTRCRRAGARRRSALHVHAAPLDPDERTEVRGVVVTSPGRTVVDLARSVPFEQAVCIADAALFQRLVTRLDLDAALARSARRPGAPAARRVVAFRERAERERRGVAQSGGAPACRPTSAVAAVGGVVRHRPMVGAGGLRMAGAPHRRRVRRSREVRPVAPTGPGSRRCGVRGEKVREDAIRDQDLRVVRWTWFELDAFAPVAERLRRAFAELAPRRPASHPVDRVRGTTTRCEERWAATPPGSCRAG